MDGQTPELKSQSGDRGNDPGEWDIIIQTAHARVGSVLQEKWRLDGLLGVGGMAAVYEATHRNGERVAVKLLHPRYVADYDVRRRFLREAYVANMIEHPGAVRVLDKDDAPDGTAFLVMGLLEGETLQARLDRLGRLPEEDALVLTYYVLDVLAAAHMRGIVHRDIKLDNVFITRAGEVKVLDFGIARLAVESKVRMLRPARNAMLGTPAFMAPEQALGRSREVDHQTDLWAVGATLFKLLTGRNVHAVATPDEQLVSAAIKPAPSLHTILPHASPQLSALVDRALAFAKADRWPDARDMQAAIRPLLAGGGQRLPAVQPPSALDAERALARARSHTRPIWPTTARMGGKRQPGKVRLREPPRWLLLVGVIAAVVLVGWLIVRGPQKSVATGKAAEVETGPPPVGPSRMMVVPVPHPITEAPPPRPPVEITAARPFKQLRGPARPPGSRRSRAPSKRASEETLLRRRH